MDVQSVRLADSRLINCAKPKWKAMRHRAYSPSVPERVLPGFNLTDTLADVIRICQLVQGLPLAIEICASWVDRLSPAQIAAQLGVQLKLLDASYRGVPERHRGMRASFAYALQRLAADEQAAWLRLSVFRGSFDAEAASAIAGVSIPLLNRFREGSLIQPGETNRYALHELLQRYARELLEARHQTADVEMAHAHYFIDKLRQLRETVGRDRSRLLRADRSR